MISAKDILTVGSVTGFICLTVVVGALKALEKADEKPPCDRSEL